MTRNREKLLILTLTLVSFVLGTTEYVIVGVLKEIESYMKVSLAAAVCLSPVLRLHTQWVHHLPWPSWPKYPEEVPY